MKLIYKGKFSGNPDDLPHGEHKEGAVKFKECDDPKRLGILANGIAFVIMVVFMVLYFLRAGIRNFSFFGYILAMLSVFPHELLHAVCFRNEVYLYTNWKQGMLFVVGPECMSKARYVFMSLLPNLVFGFVPFLLFWFYPQLSFLGSMGALTIGMGAGDYYNVYNALTQMPKGAKTYLYKFNSYWYIP